MKKLLSLWLCVLLCLSLLPMTVYAGTVFGEQLFQISAYNAEEGLKSGIAVTDDGDIYVTTNKSKLRGFHADGTSNGFVADLPSSYCGNLCAADGIVFAHATNSSQIFLYEPSQSTACKTLYGGSVCHFLTTDANGYLYCLQGNSEDGKKVAVIRRIKISVLRQAENGASVDWESTYTPHYTAPNADGNAYPKALAVDAQGNAYIVDKGSSNGYDATVNGIFKYNLNSGKVTPMQFVDAGGTLVGMTWLYSVNADAYGNVAVLSRNSNMIALFRPGSVNADVLIETKGWVEDLASDSNGDLYYLSSGNVSVGNAVFCCRLHNVPVTGVTLAKTAVALKAGDTFALKPVIAPSDATNKAWSCSSSNSRVATVSSTGVVKAVGAGTAVITVKSLQGGCTARCTVTVSKRANPLIAKGKTVTLKAASLQKKTLYVARKKALSVSKAQGIVTYAKVSGSKKISVNKKTGKITVKKGLKKGTYKIKFKVTATGNSAYKAGIKTVTVMVKVR